MEYYWPSLTAAIAAIFIIVYLFPKFSPVILASFAAAAVVYGLYSHYMMFGSDYAMMTWVDTVRSSAPMVMVSSVIIFIIGFLLLMIRSGKTPSYASNTSSSPSPRQNNMRVNNTRPNLSRSNNTFVETTA